MLCTLEDVPNKKFNQMSTLFVVGLRNFGSSYVGTRHNIGEALLRYHVSVSEVKFAQGKSAEIASLRSSSHDTLFVLPCTWMNVSGKFLKGFPKFKMLNSRNLLICCDDLDMPFGKFRIKKGGSAR